MATHLTSRDSGPGFALFTPAGLDPKGERVRLPLHAPGVGEAARKALEPAAVPSNLLMKRTIADELL